MVYSHPFFKARKNPEDLIAVGGATLMDTTLGLFSETLGPEYAKNSTINGIIFSVMAPFIVPFLRPFESVYHQIIRFQN
ncbi:MAG: LysO family transporter [Thaumarchaeota archaeon]|nr:LysO family transporter [Nitrososphaerota archaeon]